MGTLVQNNYIVVCMAALSTQAFGSRSCLSNLPQRDSVPE